MRPAASGAAQTRLRFHRLATRGQQRPRKAPPRPDGADRRCFPLGGEGEENTEGEEGGERETMRKTKEHFVQPTKPVLSAYEYLWTN